MKFRLAGICTILLFVAGAWLWPSQAQRATQKSAPGGTAPRSKAAAARPGRPAQKAVLTPQYSQAVNFAETQPVRNLPPLSRSAFNSKPGPPEVDRSEINEKNSEEVRPWSERSKGSYDAALQAEPRTKALTALPAPSLTFDGILFTDGNSSAPPDTVGDVGPNHYIQMTNNTTVGIFNKSGTLAVPYFKLNTLFASLGGLVATQNNGDPIVLYDRMADRWMISQFALIVNRRMATRPAPGMCTTSSCRAPSFPITRTSASGRTAIT